MCIYGINFTNGFDNHLYFNDPKTNAKIAEYLDEAGKDLCNSVSNFKIKDPYQEVVILNKDNSYNDLFITCCDKCDHESMIDWLIHLKSQFLLHRYALVENFQHQISYKITRRKVGYNQPGVCLTEDYRKIPATGNNAVCFTYGEQKFANPFAGEQYSTKFEDILKMGHYNSTVTKYLLGERCTMNYASYSNPEESCTINLFQKGFQYFCCCSGGSSVPCQKSSAILLRKDNSMTENLFCASKEVPIAKEKTEQMKFNMSFSTTIGDINARTSNKYEPDIHNKLADENKTRHKCFYNDRYQYLFNQYYVKTTNDVCLLHYIDNETASDMNTNGIKNGLIFHSYPGDGFYPTDFSYIDLKDDCAYVEVEINEVSIKRSVNCFKKSFNTNYMPVKIFACGCTLQKEGNHCDQSLEKKIAKLSEEYPMKLLTNCAKFEATEASMNESNEIYVRHTSYCFTEVFMMWDTISGVRLKVRADAVTRLMAAQSGKHFDHIAFSMYNLKFLQLHQLILHPLNTAGKLWCLSGPFYATIYFDKRTSSFRRKTKCVPKQIEIYKIKRTHKAIKFDNSIFCDSLPILGKNFGCFDLNLDSKKSQKRSEMACCCSDEHECEQTSLQIRLVFSHLKKDLTD
ncbi:unnamed protein product [Cercopithifilaria johnstoni]|uniref:Uncharacterized protein n=1 Tax=Cercopithifilaria johnstoni TaxID=2874296 RepID=A0A8J2Q0E0_9BILA|nr:unnamed protein product [Cercopithifilaria johnstoni]